ncbi:MAG: flagellar hook-basal body complex protein [Planctomycetota bacterium]|nr:MAG: flagellar hook-basal body complex protein [Planctomycetota bacterium]
MSFALSAGVTGLQAHQKMLDIAGNNLANVNTTAFKSSRITFAELLSETIKKASQPTSGIGGTNPQQMGTGVGIGGITPNMSQGNLVNTGNPLDLGLEGEGYFVLSDSEQNLYTRAGAFGVDAASNLVDPATGYLVQRIGSVGESDGFQTAGDSNIHVPYDVAMAANATSEVIVSGNLSADAEYDSPQIQVLSSNIAYTTNGGTTADLTTEIDQLDQFSGGPLGSGTITISGYHPDGTPFGGAGTTFNVNNSTTLGDFVDHLNNNLLTDSTASLINGRIRVTDDTGGYSLSDINFTYAGDGTLETPAYFEILTVGGDEVKSINITVYDTQGGRHVLSGAFVRTDTPNTWDLLLMSITGNVYDIDMQDRRIDDIAFNASDGSFFGLSGTDDPEFVITFGHDTANPQTIELVMGTVGQLDGLTQFAGNSTAVARGQDGYAAGRLSTVSVDNEGTVIGTFSNGIKKDIAILQIALFQNPAALESAGGGYFIPSANSGEAVATQAMTGGAGTIHGGALEKSNADVATEFVNMIQAQNGFQANARTIRIANEILRELTNLIR